jgi:TonB family protein
VAGDDKAMDLQMSMGVLDQRAVERAMAPYVHAMVECFDRVEQVRRYTSGQVVLRFVVEASGSVSDIHVIKNELGNHRVERCLTSAGRRIVFPPPEGNRKTDFEYSLRF